MANSWQSKPKKTAFQRDKTLDQKDYSMTSMNALTAAVATAQLEFELSKVTGTVNFNTETKDGVSDRILQLHELYFGLHMNNVPGNIPAQFPGSTVASENQPAVNRETRGPRPDGSSGGSGGPGGVLVSFGKHSGLTLDEVYATDPGYVRWLAGNAREAEMKAAAAGVMAEHGEEEEDPYAA